MQCFFYNRVPVSVTTTSISSRERPRARGSGVAPSTKPASSSTANATTAPVITRHHSSTPPATRRSRPNSRLEMPSIDRVQHLQTATDWKAQSKSWDSGLDMFGAVPFSTPNDQVSNSMTDCVLYRGLQNLCVKK